MPPPPAGACPRFVRTWLPGGHCCASTTPNTCSTALRARWRPCCAAARRSPSWSPAANRSVCRARRSWGFHRCRTTMRCRCSSIARAWCSPRSRSTSPTRRPSGRSRRTWTGYRWRWNWPRPGCGPSRPSRWRRAWTTGSRCSFAALVARGGGNARSRDPSTGVTRYWTRSTASCSAGSRCSPVRSGLPRRGHSAPAGW